jgi:hypothetical protein
MTFDLASATGERTPHGLELRLRNQGLSRYVGALFLAGWLCAWAIGESIVLGLLVVGAWSLLTGRPPGPDREPLELGPALAVGAFLLVWLAFWTLGGVAAIAELLRLLWGEDRLVAGSGGLTRVAARWPFRSTRVIPRDRLRRIHLGRAGVLVAETDRATIELSGLGTLEERQRAAEILRAELGTPAVSVLESADPPEGWEAIVTPEGERALVPDLALRRKQARVAAIVAGVTGTVAVILIGQAARDPGLAALAGVAMALAGLIGWGAVWLARGRMEWRIGGGRITLRRRFDARVRETFEGGRLELTARSDSDNDDWYTLDVIALPGAPGRARRRLLRTMNDAETPRRLGVWLARNADIVFDDRTGAPRARAS